MNVQELIDKLQKIEDKTLPIRVVNQDSEDEGNIWVFDSEVSSTGDSGYEYSGEVRLISGE